MDTEAEIQGGMFRWEPGTIAPRVVERILLDALADMWADCARESDPGHYQQINLFREKAMSALYAATGKRFLVN